MRRLHKAKYQCEAVAFDDSTDYALRGADMTGTVNTSKKGLGSVWLKADGNGDVRNVWAHVAATLILRNADNTITVRRYGASGVIKLDLQTTGTILVADGWKHLMWSYDMNGPTTHLYLDDVSDNTENTAVDAAFDDVRSEWAIGGSVAGDSKWNGDMAELYHNQAEYLDLSTESNRRKFRTATGKPVNLGATGAVPTGNQPILYCSVRPGNAASVFFVNKGSGGNFTDQGSIALAGTSPSD